MQGDKPALTPFPPSSTFIRSAATSAPLFKFTANKPASLSFSHASSRSSTSTSSTHNPPSLANLSEHELERQRHLRQNQQIIRLCALRSTQIRQSETKLSQLEDENLELRSALRQVEQKLGTKSVIRSLGFSVSPSPHINGPVTPLERLRLSLSSREVSKTYASTESPHESSERISSPPNRVNGGYIEPESCLWNDSEALQMKRQQTHVTSSASFKSKKSLLSKLNQVQTAYLQEHEALCSMMSNFNSTTRLYKDIIFLLEKEVNEQSFSQEREHDHGKFSPPLYSNPWADTTPSAPSDPYNSIQSSLSSALFEYLSERCSQKSPQSQSAVQIQSVPRATNDHSPIQVESLSNEQSNSQSKLVISPKRRSMYLDDMGDCDIGLEMDIDSGDERIQRKSRKCLVRPISHGLPKIKTLPSIVEQDLDDTYTQCLSPSWQQRPSTIQHSSWPQQSKSEQQQPQLKDQPLQRTVLRGSDYSRDIPVSISASQEVISPIKIKCNKLKITKSERSKAIRSGDPSMKSTDRTLVPSSRDVPVSTTGSIVTEYTDDVFRDTGEGTANTSDDIDYHSESQPRFETESSRDRSHRVRSRKIPRFKTVDAVIEDNITICSSDTNSLIRSHSHGNSLRLSAPSPMIKSRSTIASERSKHLTPKWVTRSNPGVLARHSKALGSPSETVRNVSKCRISSAPIISSSNFRSALSHNLSLSPLEEDHNNNAIELKVDLSSTLMPPPQLPQPRPSPPTTRPPEMQNQDKATRKHKKPHPLVTIEPHSRTHIDLRQPLDDRGENGAKLQRDQRDMSNSPTLDSEGSRSLEDSRYGSNVAHFDEKRRKLKRKSNDFRFTSKSRPGKGAIVYRLPNIRE
ncbi:hypothetical protein BGZ49_005879 [Haplosporangium sp. Z 27]|nr:hypothetical protein BGZ49_005879 [Haplosporangium sp. Z 27]